MTTLFRLMQPVRQAAGNPILTVADPYRNSTRRYVAPSRSNFDPATGQGFVIKDRRNVLNRYVEYCAGLPRFKEGGRMYLAANNAKADSINRRIRNRRHGDRALEEPFIAGEQFRAFTTNYGEGDILVANTELVDVTEVVDREQYHIQYLDRDGYTHLYIPVWKLLARRSSDGREVELKAPKSGHDQREKLLAPLRAAASVFQKYLHEELDYHGLRETWKKQEKDHSRDSFVSFCVKFGLVRSNLTPVQPLRGPAEFYERHGISTILTLDDRRRDAWRTKFRVEQEIADLRPPYASTVHKAQGGTYETVIIDGSTIVPRGKQGGGWSNSDCNRLAYTAITRASKLVIWLP